MKISSFLLQLELEVCQASRLLRVFCKGKGHGFTAVEKNGLFPYLQDGWLYGKMKTLYAVSQVPAAARAGGPAPLPMTAVGDVCPEVPQAGGFGWLQAGMAWLFADAAR